MARTSDSRLLLFLPNQTNIELQMQTMNNIVFPTIQSIVRSVPHGPDLPVQSPIASLKVYLIQLLI